MTFLLPLYQHVEETADPSPYQSRFAEFAGTTGAILVDALPDLQRPALAERRVFRFATDVHPTPACHSALAQCLQRAVERAMHSPRVVAWQ